MRKRAPGCDYRDADLRKFREAAGAWKTFDFLDKSFSCARFSCQEHFTPPRRYPALNLVHNAPGSNMSSKFEFSFEGKPIAAREGQSVAAALLEAGERCLRIDEAGNAKGAVCGIGACWECRCSIDGLPDTRACVTEARPGMIVCRQHGLEP